MRNFPQSLKVLLLWKALALPFSPSAKTLGQEICFHVFNETIEGNKSNFYLESQHHGSPLRYYQQQGGPGQRNQDQQHGQIRHCGNNGKRWGQLVLGRDARRLKSRWGNKSQDPGEKEAMGKGSTSEEGQMSNSKVKQTRQSEESRERRRHQKRGRFKQAEHAINTWSEAAPWCTGWGLLSPWTR